MSIAVSCWQHLLVAIPCKIYMFGMKATFLFTDNTIQLHYVVSSFYLQRSSVVWTEFRESNTVMTQ